MQHSKFISHNVFINPRTRCVVEFEIQFKDCEVQRLQLFCVELPQIDAVTYYTRKQVSLCAWFLHLRSFHVSNPEDFALMIKSPDLWGIARFIKHEIKRKHCFHIVSSHFDENRVSTSIFNRQKHFFSYLGAFFILQG